MREADVKGNHGSAWKRRSPPVGDQRNALIESWVVDWRPAGGMKREWFVIAVVHLRAGGVREFPAAEYELQVVPVRKYTDPDGPGYQPAGEPVLIGQFHGDRIGDETAGGICAVLTQTVVNAGLPPMKKAVGEWDRIVGAIMGNHKVIGQMKWY